MHIVGHMLGGSGGMLHQKIEIFNPLKFLSGFLSGGGGQIAPLAPPPERNPDKNLSLFIGHQRALCPGCGHAPQSRECFAGGSSLAEVVVVVEVVRREGDNKMGIGGGSVDGDGDQEGGELSGRAEG